MGLEGKTIAITGAARGLGAALAIVAADRGMIPLLLGRNAAGIGATADIIEKRTGRRPDAFVCDLAEPVSLAGAASKITSVAPALDILVNSGSQWVGGAFAAMTDAQ